MNTFDVFPAYNARGKKYLRLRIKLSYYLFYRHNEGIMIVTKVMTH